MVFSWTRFDCENALPEPIQYISCGAICQPGTFLGVNLATKQVSCHTCPLNTFSTGNSLRLSSEDFNWNDLPKEAQMRCYWLSANGYESDTCKSFLPLNDNSAIRTNLAEMRNSKINTFELKLNVYLFDNGTVTFSYRKGMKTESGQKNGIFKFQTGFKILLTDDDPEKTGFQNYEFPLEKGMHELMWTYNFSSSQEYSNIFAEITVLLF